MFCRKTFLKKGYTDEEQKLCVLLKEGPLITLDLAAKMKIDPYHLPSQRLEQDGIVMKSWPYPHRYDDFKGRFPEI